MYYNDVWQCGNKKGAWRKKYLYVRKRVGSRLSSTFVDTYSDELYPLLLRNARDAREFKKNIRRLDKELAALGYSNAEILPRVQLNLDFARANMKSNIYNQTILEGVATSFPQTNRKPAVWLSAFYIGKWIFCIYGWIDI